MAISAASRTPTAASPGKRRIWPIRSNRRFDFSLRAGGEHGVQPCERPVLGWGMTEPDHPDRNRRKLYGRRKGPKMSARQAGLRRTLLGELAYSPGTDPLIQFPNTVREVWLEVGFGAGEHLI